MKPMNLPLFFTSPVVNGLFLHFAGTFTGFVEACVKFQHSSFRLIRKSN
jgi:hypothetical protein